MKTKLLSIIFLIASLLLLIGNSYSSPEIVAQIEIQQDEDQVLATLIELIEFEFTNSKEELAVYTDNEVSFFLPDGFVIEQALDNNFVLKDGEHTYILFYNPLEGLTSQSLYKSISIENSILVKTFNSSEKFGFIQITPSENHSYNMTISIGGTKLTTETDLSTIKEQAADMSKILNSLNYVAVSNGN